MLLAFTCVLFCLFEALFQAICLQLGFSKLSKKVLGAASGNKEMADSNGSEPEKKRKMGKQPEADATDAKSKASDGDGVDAVSPGKKRPAAAAAKAKAALKPKGKAKGKAKAKAKGTCKRKPAAAQDTSQKGSKASFADKANKWKTDLEEDHKEEAEEVEDEDPENEGDEEESLRDLGKARKFRRLRDAKAIPNHIIELINSTVVRQEKTALINGLFKRDTKGNITMVPDQPVFENARQAYHKKFGSDETIGKPWDVFLHSDFGGNIQALNQAVQNGSVQTWTQDGLKFAGYRQTRAGVEKASMETHKLSTGEMDVNDEQYAVLGKAFSSMAWSFGDEGDNALTSSGSGKASGPKALENAGLTDKMKEVLVDAKGAQERLHAAAMRFLSKCSSVDDKQKFKPVVVELKAWIAKNEHILTFSELPDEKPLTPSNFQAFVNQQADASVKLNEAVEQFKALLRTRKEI